ncbi:hypothetical protein H9Y04_02750 [Streptomyces sp. TRM66268-LWL]|uniref:Uncharacterized protein n=1 Tax=Streptomyces polyasparticus TaxID=2767826 RepID=A0ABR7SAH2_9ACTN|nr:hypothetical protein [Streptomyces polyasparticus]MBC9711491.1 hypothetical protein [Streptomyces polyasparticus]
MRGLRRRTAGLPAAAALVGLLTAAAPPGPPAPAVRAAGAPAPAEVRCAGGVAGLSLQPGLSVVGDRQQSWSGSGLSTGCRTTTPGAQIFSVTAGFQGSGKGSCIPAFGIPNGAMHGTLTWDGIGLPDAQSYFVGTVKLTWTGVVFSGLITQGAFTGGQVHATASWDVSGNIATAVTGCLAGGYTNITGTWDTLAVSAP